MVKLFLPWKGCSYGFLWGCRLTEYNGFFVLALHETLAPTHFWAGTLLQVTPASALWGFETDGRGELISHNALICSGENRLRVSAERRVAVQPRWRWTRCLRLMPNEVIFDACNQATSLMDVIPYQQVRTFGLFGSSRSFEFLAQRDAVFRLQRPFDNVFVSNK